MRLTRGLNFGDTINKILGTQWSRTKQSQAFGCIIRLIDSKWRHKVLFDEGLAKRHDIMKRCGIAVLKAMDIDPATSGLCPIGAIDGTHGRICRPSGTVDQRRYYDGHHKVSFLLIQ